MTTQASTKQHGGARPNAGSKGTAHNWQGCNRAAETDACPIACTGPRPYEIAPRLWVCYDCLNLELTDSPRACAFMSTLATVT